MVSAAGDVKLKIEFAALLALVVAALGVGIVSQFR